MLIRPSIIILQPNQFVVNKWQRRTKILRHYRKTPWWIKKLSGIRFFHNYPNFIFYFYGCGFLLLVTYYSFKKHSEAKRIEREQGREALMEFIEERKKNRMVKWDKVENNLRELFGYPEK